MQDKYTTQATEQVQLLRTGQVCDALQPRLLRAATTRVTTVRGLPPKHSLLCAAPHKPIKKTSAPCKISSKHKQQSKFNFYAPHKPIRKTSAPCKISSKHKQQSKFDFYAPHKPIKKTSAPCKISSRHKQQSKFNFYKRDKCAMHGRSMEGSRRLIHEAAEALRLPPKLSCCTRRSQDRRAR